MKLPSWLKRGESDAPLSEHEDRVGLARSDVDACAQATKAAKDAYYASPTIVGENAILEAEELERRAQLRLKAAERGVEEARQELAKQERQRLRARRDELLPQLTFAGAAAQLEPLAAREAALIEDLARVRLERLARKREYQTRVRELRSVLHAIGEAPLEDGVYQDETGVWRTASPLGGGHDYAFISPHRVCELLEQRERDLGDGELAWLLRNARPTLKSYSGAW